MKKLLALVVVLAMAGMASAGLQFTANDEVKADGALVESLPGVINFALVNEAQATGVMDGGFVALAGPAVFGASLITPGALPGAWSLIDMGLLDLGAGEVPVLFLSWDVPAVDPFQAGKLVNFEIIGKQDDKGSVTFYNMNLDPVFSMDYSFVPEPMTLTLLGLGALVLRRRS